MTKVKHFFTMSNKMNEKLLQVEPEEVLFFYQHCDASIKNVVFDNLVKTHPNITKRLVDKELTKLKKNYNAAVIHEARRVLKAVKGVQFQNQ